jgi:hypothetical protein
VSGLGFSQGRRGSLSSLSSSAERSAGHAMAASEAGTSTAPESSFSGGIDSYACLCTVLGLILMLR